LNRVSFNQYAVIAGLLMHAHLNEIYERLID